MQTSHTNTPAARVAVPPTREAFPTRVTIIVAAVLVAVLGGALYLGSTDRTEQAVGSQDQQMSRGDITRDWVNRGLIPAQTLEPAEVSREELTQRLVNQGLIPAQTLEPTAQSRQDLIRDWVNQGLIPAQTLND